MNHKIVTNPSDKPPLGPELEIGPELDALELREYQIYSTVAQDALIEFETGEVAWVSGPRGIFRFQISLTDLGVLGRLFLQAAREFSAENYAIEAAKQPRPTATYEKKSLRNKT